MVAALQAKLDAEGSAEVGGFMIQAGWLEAKMVKKGLSRSSSQSTMKSVGSATSLASMTSQNPSVGNLASLAIQE
jgi:hypothetical protein